MKPKVFIDGEAGTTGLEIHSRLKTRANIQLLSIVEERRKDVEARGKLLNECDLAILCLPDTAAHEAVSMIDNAKTKILDASSAHRTSDGWVYGFPELSSEQPKKIKASKRVSNPGCYSTGMLALIKPLVDAGVIPRAHSLEIHAISGYSGGGKELIAICETPASKGQGRGAPFCLYGLDQKHKHLAEMRVHSGLAKEPVFLPSYSSAFYRGMLVYISLRLKEMGRTTGKPIGGDTIRDALAVHYMGQPRVTVEPLQTKLEPGFVLTPLDMNGSDGMQLRVFWNQEKDIVTLTACLDNLGKGAAGAAVQNMELMLGLV